MQDIDTNMDELFRKAGDGYPLKTDTSEWDKLAPLLLDTPAIFYISNRKKNLKKYSSLTILLLAFFLFGTLTSRYIFKNSNTVSLKLKNTILPANKTVTKNLQMVTTANQHLAIQPIGSLNRNKMNKGAKVGTTFFLPGQSKILYTPLTTDLVIESNNADFENLQKSVVPKSISKLNNESVDLQTLEVVQNDIDTFQNKMKLYPLKEEREKISETDNSKPVIAKTKNAKSRNPHRKFYYGVLAGLSLTQVKHQGLQKPGYDFGFKVGYQLTRQLSIESGLLFQQKYYYTSGEYFKMSKISSTMPVGMKIISLKGSFSVFEIPLTLKYNILNSNTRGHLYTTAGISTYLMSKEYNQYKTLLNGTQNNMTATYNNQSNYSASSLSISIGYEKSIGKSTRMRIEPYMQIPLKGIGVGDLPVTTVGIHLGVFHFKK